MADDMNNSGPSMNEAAKEAKDVINQSGGVLGGLLDFSFSTFITLRVVKLLYILIIALLAIEWLVAVIAAFAAAGFGGGLGAMITMALAVVVQIIFARIGLELVVVMFRIGENTTRMAAK